MGDKFRTLPGLPASGPLPLQFSTTGQGLHREGFVVEFWPGTENAWVGNFQPGLSTFDAIAEHPNGKDVVVVAGGDLLVVDPARREQIATLSGTIQSCTLASELPALVFDDGISILILHTNGMLEQTARISWDGMRDIHVEGTVLSGEAYDPMADSWHSFRVDLLEAEFEGGSYRL